MIPSTYLRAVLVRASARGFFLPGDGSWNARASLPAVSGRTDAFCVGAVFMGGRTYFFLGLDWAVKETPRCTRGDAGVHLRRSCRCRRRCGGCPLACMSRVEWMAGQALSVFYAGTAPAADAEDDARRAEVVLASSVRAPCPRPDIAALETGVHPPPRRRPSPRARLLSWFLDAPSAPFGVHRMALAGKAAGKDVGIPLPPPLFTTPPALALVVESVTAAVVTHVKKKLRFE
ncbi:hypothetical protein B0H17DRAFT_1340698 [Mycena rosella]|uniref:Uncharacterized protein n=1 Tax=Mycena rosella TaxID=1033263 RepID=A0AAD7BH44_MYCRO|nr:hypothetical protein B0H17DRAFT_1340698 [Mycena rosella]